MNYLPVISTGADLLLLIAVGYFLVKLKVIAFSTIAATNRFLLTMCYPLLIFRSVAKSKFNNLDFMPMIIGTCIVLGNYVLCGVVVFFVKKQKFYYYLSTALPVCYTNYLIIGLPFFHVIWPGLDDSMVTIINLTNDVIAVPIFLIMANIYQVQEHNRIHREKNDGQVEKFSFKLILTIIKNILLNPIMFGNIASFIWCATGWEIPTYIMSTANLAANGVLGLCLICVGGFLSQFALVACPWPQFIFMVFMRHFSMSFVGAISCYIFKVKPLLARQCTLVATLPSATASFLLSHNAGTGPGASSTMIFFSTVFCVPALIAWLYCLDKLHIFVDK
ncbi:Auxin Efflux Carrier family protein [Trichomonas vaginalis G3]|uniref:Auxin Efflux Carrier family protein n=1 Tax=Trichomonas vaginalis (strain ATCC PRA-98 / G3) TaxID=412133 RepID=A2DXX9_TRIV3|nr:intracellular auxin transport [Trichomonas vaginalis G3]EAY14715.1 Auxin Efflux Carrier family protein [Trichomonas vaginalis G3]KAI5487914.1 intracellular auxin transport [Trichomonas vaginalis G3]|eukprot:XP_001326938.1 Auxin Efflux Carrier family protein [Trichomonas vaginalis G3]